MRCQVCKGPFHPASGDYDRKWDVATCGPCIRHFYAWAGGHTRQRRRGFDFYECAKTSIRAGSVLIDPVGGAGLHAGP